MSAPPKHKAVACQRNTPRTSRAAMADPPELPHFRSLPNSAKCLGEAGARHELQGEGKSKAAKGKAPSSIQDRVSETSRSFPPPHLRQNRSRQNPTPPTLLPRLLCVHRKGSGRKGHDRIHRSPKNEPIRGLLNSHDMRTAARKLQNVLMLLGDNKRPC